MALPNLPTELIIHVFSSVDKIGSAAALSQTSHRLHEIWRHNLPSICDAVFPRMIECYDQARQLLEAMAKSDKVVAESSVEDKYKAAVIRARVLISNDNAPHKALRSFASSVPTEWVELLDSCPCVWNGTGHDENGCAVVIGPSRIRFIEGYYRALSMVYLGGRSAAKRYDFLASMNLLDFFRMFELVEYIFFHFGHSENVPGKNRDLPGYDSWPSGFRDNEDYSEKLMNCVEYLDLFEHHMAVSLGIPRHMADTYRSSGPSILHDDCLDDVIKKTKIIAMAHVLPQLPNDILSDPRYELFTPQ